MSKWAALAAKHYDDGETLALVGCAVAALHDKDAATAQAIALISIADSLRRLADDVNVIAYPE